MGNDTSLSIPIAIDAGMGELSRIGIVITPKYGPRVRWAKVLTDMPLVPDGPISFGVTEFCEVCEKCADECPGGAIKKGKRSYNAPDSGNSGVLKWAVEGFKCQQVWSDIGTDCFTCIRSCPFTKPDNWLHEITRVLIGVRAGPIDKLLVKLDDASQYGKPDEVESYWDKDNFIHVDS
jgi:reductive dehalogenase